MASALLGRRSHRLLGGALAIWVLAAITLVTPAGAQGIDTSPEPLSLARFGEVPAFTFVERSGKEISREDLLGRPWIAVPFFVGCTGPCPTVTSDLRVQLVEDEDLAASGVRVVSFSVDPEFDTPERLRAYAEQYGIGSEDPWLFLTGDPSEMEQFVVHGLKTSFVRSEEAGVEYGQSITHATRVPVIDSLGRIAGWYQVSRQALEGGSIDDALALLRSRALALASPYPLVTLNALLNGAATLLLLAGWVAIRRGRRELHARLMGSAFLVSAAFLASYLYYHLVVQKVLGPVRFNGTGTAKTAYFVLLASHVILAIVNLPMVLRTLWLARAEDWERHKSLARKTFPIWMYVSVTGVLVYLVLYHWNPTPGTP